MSEKILITGGAGFIGRHVTSALLSRGYDVVVLDVLLDQVHSSGSPHGEQAPGIPKDVEFIRQDIRDPGAVLREHRGARPTWIAADVGELAALLDRV